MWKKLFVAVTFLLLISLVLNAHLWQRLNLTMTLSSPVGARLESIGGNQILERYAEIRKEINRRIGAGEDRKSFITPDDPAVTTKVQEITGGFSEDAGKYWRDCEKLYRWVPQNIEYCPDSYTPELPEFINDKLTWARDFWKMPEETLTDKAGDCEDMVALLASMFLNYNQGRYSVWVIEIGNKERGHVAVALPVEKGKLVIFDPSVCYATGPSEMVIGAKPTATAINDWLTRWGKELPDARIRAVFNNAFCQEFESTEEFLSWADRQ